jgi:hypothetical protein
VREIQSSVEIESTPERVWEILTDVDAYPDWNPFIRRLTGTLELGARLEVRIEPPGARAMTFRPTVRAVEPNRELRWLGRFLLAGFLDGEHTFLLEPTGENRVRFIQRERFRGALVPLARRTIAKTRIGFEEMNSALKIRAEKPAGAP